MSATATSTESPPPRRRPFADVRWILTWIGVLWAVEAAEIVLRWMSGGERSLMGLGVRPRDAIGLSGIVFAPFLHYGIQHLVYNSVSLFITGLISCRYGRRLTFAAACWAELYAGGLTWLIGRPGTVHVGISGVIFGLIGFVLINAVVRKGIMPLLLALLILYVYWTALIHGIQPSTDATHQATSWQMHLGGLIGGVMAGWFLRERRPS